MPTLTITKDYADGDLLLEADLDAIRTDITDWANTTKLDSDNIQDDGILPGKISCDESTIDGTDTTLKVKALGIDSAQIAADAVITAKILDANVTSDKLAANIGTFVGEIKNFHSFNGTVSIPRGWMQLNADVINETNYEAIHGVGTYATDGVSASAIVGKNLPGMSGMYPVGAATTTQDGTSAITGVGNTDHEIDIEHNHNWYVAQNSNVSSTTYDSSGSSITIGQTTSTKNSGASSINIQSDELYDGPSGYTDNQLSTTQDIQPESIEFIYIMRVI